MFKIWVTRVGVNEVTKVHFRWMLALYRNERAVELEFFPVTVRVGVGKVQLKLFRVTCELCAITGALVKRESLVRHNFLCLESHLPGEPKFLRAHAYDSFMNTSNFANIGS